MSRNFMLETPVGPDETKLTNAINWLPRSDPGQFVGFVADDKLLKGVDFSQLISREELKFTEGLQNNVEVNHFILRRAFQRCFMKKVTAWQGHPSELPMQHQRDARPACLAAPDLCLSFSTSGTIAIAAASGGKHIGIDVETLRPVDNALALSTRFFNPSETAHLTSLAGKSQELEFLRFWTIKEACLKAAGKGIVDGLEKFLIVKNSGKYGVKPAPGMGREENWTIEALDLPANYIATLTTYAPD
jgi:phosphopantetheinyl transferase